MVFEIICDFTDIHTQTDGKKSVWEAILSGTRFKAHSHITGHKHKKYLCACIKNAEKMLCISYGYAH